VWRVPAVGLLVGLTACGGQDGVAPAPPDAAQAVGCSAATGTITYQQVILASRMVVAQGTFIGGSVDDCPALKPADLAKLDAACPPAADLAACQAKVACQTQPRAGTTQSWSGEYMLRNMSLLGPLTLQQRTPNATATCKYDVIGRFSGAGP
jgi:hypothetical protein